MRNVTVVVLTKKEREKFLARTHTRHCPELGDLLHDFFIKICNATNIPDEKPTYPPDIMLGVYKDSQDDKHIFVVPYAIGEALWIFHKDIDKAIETALNAAEKKGQNLLINQLKDDIISKL